MLEAGWETDPPAGRPPRHLYRITGAGARAAAEAAVAARSPRAARPPWVGMTAVLLALVVRLLPDREWGRAMLAEFAAARTGRRSRGCGSRSGARAPCSTSAGVAACESAGCASWPPRSLLRVDGPGRPSTAAGGGSSRRARGLRRRRGPSHRPARGASRRARRRYRRRSLWCGRRCWLSRACARTRSGHSRSSRSRVVVAAPARPAKSPRSAHGVRDLPGDLRRRRRHLRGAAAAGAGHRSRRNATDPLLENQIESTDPVRRRAAAGGAARRRCSSARRAGRAGYQAEPGDRAARTLDLTHDGSRERVGDGAAGCGGENGHGGLRSAGTAEASHRAVRRLSGLAGV